MFLPSHVTPSPLNPVLQAQAKLPCVLVHIAFESQLSVPPVHSSTSEKVTLRLKS